MKEEYDAAYDRFRLARCESAAAVDSLERVESTSKGRRLRICFAIPGMPNISGGPSLIVAELAARLCDYGHDVTVLTADLVPRGADAAEAIAVDQRVRMQAFRVRSRFDRRLYRSRAMRAWFAEAASGFNVVDIIGVWSFVAIDVARICHATGVPYIVTPQGQMAVWDWSKHPTRKRVFFRFFLEDVWNLASAIRFCADREVTTCAVPIRSRHVVAPNPVAITSVELYSDRAKALRKELAIPESAPVLLFLGRLDDQKGVLEAIEAFEILSERRPDAFFLIVGPGDSAYGRAVADRVRRSSRSSKIRRVGAVYGDQKFVFHAVASLFITLSKNEGLSVATLEALASRLPVVITAESNLPDVEAYDAGAIIEGKPRAAARALEMLISDPAKLCALGDNAKRLVEARYSWTAVLPRLIALYEQSTGTGNDLARKDRKRRPI